MKKFLIEAWSFFWNIGFSALFLAAYWVVVIYRVVNDQDVSILRVISYTFERMLYLQGHQGLEESPRRKAGKG